MTGAYLRVKRHGKWENVEIEYLTDDERANILGKESSDRLLQWISVLSKQVRECEQVLEDLVEDGVLTANRK